MKLLKLNTLNCPDCKTPLHFECFQGMRMVREIGETSKYYYSALCPDCKKEFKVKSNKPG